MQIALPASLLVAITLAMPAYAQVYRSVDRHGNVTYSDQPGPNSKRVYVPPVQTYTPQPLPDPKGKEAAAGDDAAAKPVVPSYDVAIVSPAHDSAFRQNDGNVSVSVSMEPPLRDTHRLRLLLDGQPVGEPGTSTSFVLPQVDRGTHVLAAEVVDAAGEVIKRSGSVVFHLQRVAVGG